MLPLVEYPNFCTTIYLLYMGYLEQTAKGISSAQETRLRSQMEVRLGGFEILQAVHWSLDGVL